MDILAHAKTCAQAEHTQHTTLHYTTLHYTTLQHYTTLHSHVLPHTAEAIENKTEPAREPQACTPTQTNKAEHKYLIRRTSVVETSAAATQTRKNHESRVETYTRMRAARTPNHAHRRTHPATAALVWIRSTGAHRRAVRLPSADGMLPESWLQHKSNILQDTRTAIAPPPTPASRPQRIAAQRITSIKLSQILESQSAIAHAQHRGRVTPRTTHPDSPRVLDAIIPLDKPATLRRPRKSQRNDSDTMYVRTGARHTTATQRVQTASECCEGRIRNTATRRLTAET
jgi:hypothetical protein